MPERAGTPSWSWPANGQRAAAGARRDGRAWRNGLTSVDPDSWRSDLLRIVLAFSAVMGSLVCIPSIYLAARRGMTSVVIVDTAAIVTLLALFLLHRLPVNVRAGAACIVYYIVGAVLLMKVGSISQIYLFGFSLLTALLLSRRWGMAAAALNTVTMLAVGYLGSAAPEMTGPGSRTDFGEWGVITANFAFVNFALVLALSAVIGALEGALARAFAAHQSLDRERLELVDLNASLEQEVRERARSEQALLESRALLRIAGRTARLGGWRIEVDSGEVDCSDEVCDLFEMPHGGAPSRETILATFSPAFLDTVTTALDQCGRLGIPFDAEGQIVTASGTALWLRMIGNAQRDDRGKVTHIRGSLQDITPQKVAESRNARLEDQLRLAQKLETIGSLAGGVAHDFNNLMSIVLSYSEMLSQDLQPGDPMRADLEEIHKAGVRAADLTRQLLAFSRRQVLAPKVVDLADVVGGMESMLRRLISEDVELTIACASGIGTILVDPGQMEQVIMNLAVNASDAMPRGGMLTIATSAVTLDGHYTGEHVGVAAGPHIMLSVSDTGSGMDRETQARMFEPFFTTKEPGKGTGLGLATVFGIVKQSGGTVSVYSEPGCGTSFKVYFPLASPLAASATPAPGVERQSDPRSETILLVEDEDSLRTLAGSILRKEGYNVLDAQNAGEAFLLCEQFPATIHLLLTDVVMPRMSGRQLAERLRPIRPDMKVLYMSGYTDDAVVRHGILDSTIAFIQKPITPPLLTRKVREVLDGHLERAAEASAVT